MRGQRILQLFRLCGNLLIISLLVPGVGIWCIDNPFFLCGKLNWVLPRRKMDETGHVGDAQRNVGDAVGVD